MEQLEIPSTFKRLGTSLNIAIKSSGAESMRSVLEVAAAARIQMNVGDMDDLDSKLMQSLDKVEKEIGGPLMRGDKKGMALFSKELDVSCCSYPSSSHCASALSSAAHPTSRSTPTRLLDCSHVHTPPHPRQSPAVAEPRGPVVV